MLGRPMTVMISSFLVQGLVALIFCPFFNERGFTLVSTVGGASVEGLVLGENNLDKKLSMKSPGVIRLIG